MNIAPVRSSLHYSILSSYIQVNNSYKEVLLCADLTRIMYLIRNKRKRKGEGEREVEGREGEGEHKHGHTSCTFRKKWIISIHFIFLDKN